MIALSFQEREYLSRFEAELANADPTLEESVQAAAEMVKDVSDLWPYRTKT